jgi:hypothetical protein
VLRLVANNMRQGVFCGLSGRVTRVTAPARLSCSSCKPRFSTRRPCQRQEGDAKMATIYEHSFGFWEIDGQEEQTFFEYVQRQSV